MSDEAESSSQALDRYLAQQLASQSLNVPEDDVAMMGRFIEEEGLERDERIEGVKAMLEGLVEELPAGIDDLLSDVLDEYDRLCALIPSPESSRSPSPTPDTKDILATITPEELERAKKAALLRQYAYVDASPEDLAMAGLSIGGRDPNAPVKGASKEADKAAEERRKAIEEAIRLDGRKKKYKKAKEETPGDYSVDLLAPNLNKDKMAYKAQAEREAQKKASGEKKDRDRLALEKQRADQAKAKADKQKKAAKQERRA